MGTNIIYANAVILNPNHRYSPEYLDIFSIQKCFAQK